MHHHTLPLPTLLTLLITTMLMHPAPADANDHAPARLHDHYADAFLIGTCVGTALLQPDVTDDEPTRQLIANHFNALTPENAMKWSHIHPQPEQYDFAAADALLDFADRHGHTVFGHTLIWHNQTPDWVFHDEHGHRLDRDALIQRMRDHIHTVVGRYRGRIAAWDVVNEPLRDGPGDDTLRDSPWRDIIGDDYIHLAHRFAHEADPDAILIVNDYSIYNDHKRARMVQLVRDMLDRDTPVHAVGLQGHWTLNHPSPEHLQRMLDDLAALGLPLHVTELDMNLVPERDHDDPYHAGLPDDIAHQQATRYAQWFAIFHANAHRLARVSFWGPHDGQSWLNTWPTRRTNHPLLFDRHLHPKPAFDAVLNPRTLTEPARGE